MFGNIEQHSMIMAEAAHRGQDEHEGSESGDATDDDHEADMAASWLMLTETGRFAPLPGEEPLHETNDKMALELSTPTPVPNVAPVSIRCPAGKVFVTTHRVLYIATKPTAQFQNWACLILGLEDSHLGSGLFGFGAWFWEASFRPTPGGNLPMDHLRVKVKLTFNEGGHDQFLSRFSAQKERLHHARQIMEETGQRQQVHGEQLPEYSPQGRSDQAPESAPSQTEITHMEEQARRQSEARLPVPDGPPPGYDEAQAQAVNIQLDERAQQDAERS